MDTRERQRAMYGLTGPTRPQRFTMAAGVGGCVLLVLWILFGGLPAIGHMAGRTWAEGDATRRACLAAALSIYYVRILFTEFVFLKRGVSWTEVLSIVPWALFIYLLLAISGGLNPSPFGAAGWAGVVLFAAGSWMNTSAEHARDVWKRRPENRGRLYTLGLFRYSRHPNYLGDLISFSGLCLMAGTWITIVIPLLMLAGFVFVNIPVLDGHLQEKYPADFEAYARRTARLIPFLY